MSDDQMHALQDQRHREALAVEMAGLRICVAEAEAKGVQQQADLAALRADAERARWCERNGADVTYSDLEKLWWVQWLDQQGLFIEVSHPDRNASIDKAIKEAR
jgi:hypothetical protein